ncbi:MAG: anti-sigma factor antagonist [Cyanobacteria bacterium P01_H01_bin.35]
MEINIRTEEEIKVVEVIGDIDANTAADVQKQVVPLAEPSSKILMDMTQVPYMSSAGLRMLLSLYRQAQAKEGKVVLVGLSEELQDTMSVTGFLDLFTTAETFELGITALN